MKAPQFQKWFSGLTLLNQPQRSRVQQALLPAAGLDQVIALIDSVRAAGRRCPSCDGAACHRHGHANNLQRYRCRACGRTFNDLSGTPLARLRLKGKWLDYVAALLASTPVRPAAERVGVHRNTAFRWRHRFLHWVKLDRPQRLTGIVEADETFLLESQKGSRKLDRPARRRGGRAKRRGISRELDCILVARDRSGQTIDAVTGRGALTAAQLTRHLLPKLDAGNIALAAQIASVPEHIRGYGHVKEAHLEQARAREAELLREWDNPLRVVVVGRDAA